MKDKGTPRRNESWGRIKSLSWLPRMRGWAWQHLAERGNIWWHTVTLYATFFLLLTLGQNMPMPHLRSIDSTKCYASSVKAASQSSDAVNILKYTVSLVVTIRTMGRLRCKMNIIAWATSDRERVRWHPNTWDEKYLRWMPSLKLTKNRTLT